MLPGAGAPHVLMKVAQAAVRLEVQAERTRLWPGSLQPSETQQLSPWGNVEHVGLWPRAPGSPLLAGSSRHPATGAHFL